MIHVSVYMPHVTLDYSETTNTLKQLTFKLIILFISGFFQEITLATIECNEALNSIHTLLAHHMIFVISAGLAVNTCMASQSSRVPLMNQNPVCVPLTVD